MSRLIAVALYHRDHFSKGQARRTFGADGFHWAIAIIVPGAEEAAGGRRVFDATDASEIDPATFRLNNPSMEWWFRDQQTADPTLAAKLLGQLVIGQVPAEAQPDELRDFFEAIPLPVKDSNPQESCRTWVLDAIRALQKRGWAPAFDLQNFEDEAVAYADRRLEDTDSKEPSLKYFVARD
ncbi:serine/threonine protein kinase [Sarocladium implicatum]|nr:serine/threonine protein kinase [Sarocladium implicatum]